MYLQLDQSQGSFISTEDKNPPIYNLKDSYTFEYIDIYFQDEDGYMIDFRGVDNVINLEFLEVPKQMKRISIC